METRRETEKRIQQKRAARRRRRFIKYTIPRALFALLLIAVITILIACMSTNVDGGGDGNDGTTPGTETRAETQSPETTEQTEPAVFFELTAEERTLIEQVVSAESRGEPYDGQVAVAQCILNACLKDGIRPAEAIVEYKYTKNRVEPTSSVRRAVAAVFDRGEGVTDEPIIYFYNPAIGCGDFHETQIFVIEIKNHRFFKEAE